MNKIIIISAPSGAGKTTIVKELLKKIPDLSLVVSTTTRGKRNNETSSDYNFISVREFKDKISKNEFIEWEEVYENTFYGTLKSDIKRNKTILIKDVIGALNLKKILSDSVTIFIRPPSFKILEERLGNRGTDSDEVIRERLKKAKIEMTYEDKYDYSVLNDDINRCANEIYSILLNI